MFSSRRITAGTIALAILALPLAATSADAAPKAKHYKTCASLNKVYPHGVGKSGAKDKTTGKPVTSFTRSTKVYNFNNGPRNTKTGEYDLDRDNDGVACEKR